jgi:AraC-like DNA-binding protein
MHWEFTAVLAGFAAPRLSAGPDPDDRPALWIFPPHFPFGWTGRPGKTSEVCIFHLANAPHLLRTACRSGEASETYLRIPLDTKQRQNIRKLDQTIADLLAQRPEAGEIAADLARGHCASLAVTALPKDSTKAVHDSERLIKRTLVWMDQHLDQGIGVADAARAMGLSPAHLRRLSHQVSGRSPRDLLDELRLDRARKLLSSDDERGLDAIAWDCGYTSAVALSQAFLRRHGIRPGQWRNQNRGRQN